ncbi:hypothetical protein CPT03_10460 [Pedobacter ginsengisoli]|uniref:Uncharacterized protein n=1 Tax=Pedobacter ginsengisoli TaxID=363852 RepID=A0A2D1U5I2_9SPHI|nr:hypothetical protein [Pedobacter ginsengisoli]ATP56870.1 hypothetical protein CPT03_10460 [Pedobacter ginsengisoli]
MKIGLITLLLFCGTATFAQSFKYPILNPQGKTIKSLIPAQWKVIDSVYGDLNNDKVEDLALIYEFYAAVKENRAYGDNTTELITEIQRPRILAVYFKSGRSYKLVTQNNNFILRSEEGGSMGDPLRPLAITDNVLNLAFEGGANWRWKLNYSFKYQDKDWQLTKASNYSYHSGSGDMNSKRYDFVNKKRIITIGKINNKDSGNEIIEQNLTFKTLRTFSSFKKPWTWELGPDEFL